MDLRLKRPSTLSLKLFSHGGGEKERMMEKKNGRDEWRRKGQKFKGNEGKYVSLYLSWIDFLIKSLGQISLVGLKHKLNFPRLEFEWLIFGHQEGF